jgi:signal transduction histidine kinase
LQTKKKNKYFENIFVNLEKAYNVEFLIQERDYINGDFNTLFESSNFYEDERTKTKQITNSKGFILGYIKVSNFEEFEANIISLLQGFVQEYIQVRRITKILGEVNRAIPLNMDFPSYAYELTKLVATALDARYAILRMYPSAKNHDNKLLCESVYDREKTLEKIKDKFDIYPEDILYELYQDAAKIAEEDQTYITNYIESSSPETFELMRKINLNIDIKSFYIAPLVIGGNIVGFINFGYSYEVQSANEELSAMATIANHTAVALDAFRKLAELTKIRAVQLRRYVDQFNIDIIQGLKHTAGNSLFLAQVELEKTKKFHSYSKENKLDPITRLDEAIKETAESIHAMDELKPGEVKNIECDISKLFDDAHRLVSARIKKANVKVSNNAHKLSAIAYGRLIKIAFANLLLNSVQAYEEDGNSIKDRRITFNAHEQNERLIIYYSDNGPGIRFKKDIRKVEDIWETGKTSKKNGTGYGLTFVREVFQVLHNGSIDLRSSSEGVLFQIQIDQISD